ncbi:hypothetical protein KFK09_000317 [Dendrobium nobile]|uniref:Uncharacterized protein n=1 Tax=Dendrobium nobile TaxID=94219 RepID=A0A8T3CDM5_DENNO|nr:hypothetical protein KFK09_000317 [Dendrobium nobile]
MLGSKRRESKNKPAIIKSHPLNMIASTKATNTAVMMSRRKSPTDPIYVTFPLKDRRTEKQRSRKESCECL